MDTHIREAVQAPGPALPGEVHYFHTSEEWHALRAADITASTFGGHFRLSKWSSIYADHLEKSGKMERDTGDSSLMRAGRHLEAGIAAMAAEEEGWKTLLDGPGFWELQHPYSTDPKPIGFYLRDRESRMGATPDRVLVLPDGTMRPVEVKNVSWQAWRDEWTDGQAPVKYWLQGQLQAGVARRAGLPWIGPVIVPLVAGNDLHCLPYDFDEAAYAHCQEHAAEFWADVAAGREPTADLTRQIDRDAVRRRWKISVERTLDLSHSDEALQVAQALVEARKRQTDAGKEADLLSAHLTSLITDSETVKLAQGWTVTAKTGDRAGYEVKPTTVRVLRVKPPAVPKAPKAAKVAA